MNRADKNLVLQIFTGGYKQKISDIKTVENRLLSILCVTHVEKIIMGWSVEKEVYRKVIEIAKKYGTEVYLWLPVLSETGLLAPVSKLINSDKEKVQSFHLKEGENFEFYCPNHAMNFESVIQIYEKYFSEIPFDGVFLDKIRYGSFSNGLDGVFNCFCPQCMERYQKDEIPIDELVEEMKKVRQRVPEYQKMPLGISGYQNGTYEFENPVWSSFFSWKAKIISEKVGELMDGFRARKLKVGIDTFSPFIAYFVGQDIKTLGEKADFVKPMMYRLTHAPAGLPWEIRCLLEETLGQEWEQTGAGERYLDCIHCTISHEGIVDTSFAVRELEQMAKMKMNLYPGIEVNRIAKIAESTPDYIKECVQEFSKLPIQGFVLAWDLLSAPMDNIEMVIQLFQQHNDRSQNKIL